MAIGGIEVGELYATLKLNKSEFQKAAHESGVSITGLAKVAVASGAIIAAAFAGASVVGADFAASYGKTSARVAAITGSNITEASKLVAIFQRYGIEGDSAIKTIGMLEKNVGILTSTEKGAVKFQDTWGFSLRDANGHAKDANTLIAQAADYFTNKSIPASQKAALEAKLFGKSWQVLVPILSLGSKGIREAEQAAADLGLVLTKQNAKELAEYRKATIEADEAMGGLKLQIGLFVIPVFAALAKFASGTLIPAIRSVLGAVKEWVSANGPLIAAIQQVIGFVVGGLVKGIGMAVTIIGRIGDVVRELAPTVLGVFQKVSSAVTSFATTALPAVSGAIDFLASAAQGVVDAFTPVLANSDELKGALVIIGGVVTAVVVPPFVAWAAATLIAAAPLLLIAGAVAGLILVLEHFGILGPVVEAVTRAVGAAFDWVTTNVLPALQAAFGILTGTVLPAIGAGVGVVTNTVLPAFGTAFDWITTNILPPIMSVVGTLSKVILPALGRAFGAVVSWVVANLPTMRAIWATVAAAIGAVIHAAASAVKTAFEAIANVIGVVAPIIVKVGEVVFPALGAAASILLNALSVAFTAIGVVWNGAWAVAKTVADGIGAAWGGLVGVIGTVWDTISGIVKGGANFLIGIVNGIISAIDGIQVHIGRIGIDTPGGFVGIGPFDWNGLNIAKIPYLAAGTPNFAGGLARINELGPETAVLPKGTRVLTADETRRNEAAQQPVHYHYDLTVRGDVKARDETSILRTLQRLTAIGPAPLTPSPRGTPS